MRRRDFLRYSAAVALGSGLAGKARAEAAVSESDLDRFGGWKAKRFKATGFFRVEKGDRWWLVTPEGNAFLSFGINHFHTGLWKQDFSRKAWRKRLGLENLNSPRFAPALRAWFLKTCREYGCNTAGVQTTLSVLNTPRPALPYMQPVHFVDIPHWRPEIPGEAFRDVFSAEFSRHCDQMARRLAAPARDDPFLLGYAMTDCPLFTEEDCRERPDVIGGAGRKSRITDKPIVNGDSAYTMITEHMPRPYGPVADNIRRRAEWTDEFFRSAFARPEFVGWHYCGLIDATQQIARKQDRQHSGLMDAYGEPYPELKTVLRACADDMYEIAARGEELQGDESENPNE